MSLVHFPLYCNANCVNSKQSHQISLEMIGLKEMRKRTHSESETEHEQNMMGKDTLCSEMSALFYQFATGIVLIDLHFKCFFFVCIHTCVLVVYPRRM